MKTLIDQVTILTLDQESRQYKNGYVLIDGDRIAAVGQGAYSGEYDSHIDGRHGILLPGFINTHCHVPMIPFRTMGDDCPDRLRRFLFPLELEAMTPELVYLSAKYGICEMLLSGTTTFLDMYYFEEEVARAAEELGIRAYLGETVINMETCDSREPYGGLKLGEAFIKKWKGHPLITPLIAPHATNTNDPWALKEAYSLAEQYNTLFTIHASEMDYELAFFRDAYQMTPIQFLDSIGVLGDRTLAAHCIHLTEADIEILRRTNTSVSHCIGSNTKAGKGVAPVKEMTRAGITVSLGTDGPSSGNTLSMFTQLRLFASFHKTSNHDRALFPADEILRLGTSAGAKALHAEGQTGAIEVGKKADLILVETGSVNMFPCFEPYSALVYSANASNVELVMVDGRILVRDKKLQGVDLAGLREQLSEAMGDFYKAAGKYHI